MKTRERKTFIIRLRSALFILFVVSGEVILRGQVQLERAFPLLSFANPVDLQDPRDGTSRLFVLEQAGVIRVFENSPSAPSAFIFLDIRDRVTSGGETGLLGLAFHPKHRENGYFYVNYTAPNPLHTVVARYTVSTANPNQADKSSELILLQFNQPFSNHNGGQVSFGPDGYLYIATGDGGSAGDPLGNAQNRASLLGKILRIDVERPSQGRNYGIPPDNPLAGNVSGYREEVYAYGLRNPWRFSFDPVTGKLWTGDVGQNRLEEIDIVEKGKNYGWNIMEGTLCYNPSSNCNRAGLEQPLWEYGRTLGQSITGGFVYRGSNVPELVGAYIYADYLSRRVWALRYDGVNSPINTELLLTNLNIVSFGVDSRNELYLCAFDGRIYRFKPTTTTEVPATVSAPQSFALLQNYPNPFNPATTFEWQLGAPGFVTLKIFSGAGEEIATVVSGYRPAGLSTVVWDASNRASGVYFYRLQSGNFLETKKLILIR